MDYFIGRSIGDSITGIEKAQLSRLRLFKHYRKPAQLLWFSYSRQAAANITQVGLEPSDVLSMFDWYQHAQQVPSTLITPAQVQPADTKAVNGGKEGDVQAVNFVRGQRVIAQVRFAISTQAVINVLWPDAAGRVKQTDTYDVRGFLALRSYFTSGGKLDHEAYLTPDGAVAIEILYNGAKERGITKIKLADGQTFSTMAEWKAAFLQTLDQAAPSRFFFDRDYTDELLTELPLQGPKFFVLHNNHRTYNQVMQASKAEVLQGIGVNRKVATHHVEQPFKGLEAPGNISGIITSTTQQQAALAKDYANLPPVYVVPVGVSVELPKRVQFSERIPQELVVVSRLSTEKGIDDSIASLIALRRDFPTVHMSVYGAPNGRIGQAYLRQLNERLLKAGVTDGVSFMGFRRNLADVYDHAAMLVVTSRTEAFSISIEEALSHGCPVVSYDIEFGPRDMIEDGVNGKLVPAGDVEAMVHTIGNLLRTPSALQSLSKGAYQLRHKYGAEAVWAQYQALPDR